MAWIESHQELRDHPKVKELARLMCWEYCHTLGHLHYFWLWCLQFAPEGDIRKYNDIQIAEAAGVAADKAKEFIDAMINCGNTVDADGNRIVSGFIDRLPYFRVHDWWEYAGRFLQGRHAREPEKWKRIKYLYEPTSNLQATNEQPASPYRTVPNRTLPQTDMRSDATAATPAATPAATAIPKNAQGFDFEAVWALYPRRIGKKAAMRHFGASVKTAEDYQSIQTALKNYLKSDNVKRGFIQHGSTWFNNWRDWSEYRDEIRLPQGISMIFKAYRLLKGQGKDQELPAEARDVPDVEKFLTIFGGDWKTAVACMDDLGKEFDSKKLTWNLGTICKHAADWKLKHGKDFGNV